MSRNKVKGKCLSYGSGREKKRKTAKTGENSINITIFYSFLFKKLNRSETSCKIDTSRCFLFDITIYSIHFMPNGMAEIVNQTIMMNMVNPIELSGAMEHKNT